MNVYSIDIKICATAYIKAESREAAEATLKTSLTDTGVELFTEEHGELPISGREYTDPELPEVSISPCITLYGAWDGQAVDLVEEDVPEGEDA